jgi:hypothetical protein
VEHLSGAHLLALLTNVREGRKGLPRTNAPAYFAFMQGSLTKWGRLSAVDLLVLVWKSSLYNKNIICLFYETSYLN